MPLVQTRGAASAQGFGEFAQASAPVYVEDVFSTFIYTGDSTNRSIVNNIDLSGKGGLVWIKDRNAGLNHTLFDTARGATNYLFSDNTNAQGSAGNTLTAFNSTGFDLGTNSSYVNGSGYTYVGWTFREQPKFFDIVTWTGNGTTQNIPHSLGATPGCIIVKNISSANGWQTWHRGLTSGYRILLNSTAAETNVAIASVFGNNSTYVAPTSTQFTVGNEGAVNQSGETMVAYLFAHDAGGFGLTGLDNVISCGSFTTDGSGNGSVTLGYEPQFLITKGTDNGTNWNMVDTMRGATADGVDSLLRPNLGNAEISASNCFKINSTGFSGGSNILSPSTGIIYIAIRRGPMKVPTTGTSVFQPVTYSGNGSNDRLVDTTITPDLFIDMRRDNTMPRYVLDRLRGNGRLYSNLTNAESSNTAQIPANTFNINQTGVTVSADEVNASGRTFVLEAFRRAPGFFDEVCYTGTGSAMTVSHNLAAVPELMIVKRRNSVTYGEWFVYTATLGNAKYQLLDTTQASTTANSGIWNLTTPTSTIMSVGSDLSFSASPYVAYLFATCAGVSKVGSYTGTGALQTVACGFTSGARFVLIKRTDSTGDWYVWDSARGISSGNDPYLLLNTDAAEVTGTNYVDTDTTGFKVTAAAPAGLNANGGTYIFLAIA